MATPLASWKISDSIFNFADPENLTIRVRKYCFFAQNWNWCVFSLFLPKFGCHGNSLGSLEMAVSLFEYADLENITIRVKNSSFLRRTEIGAIFVYFCPNLVAMATPLAPWKFLIAYLISPTPKTSLFVWKILDFVAQNWNRRNFFLFFAQVLEIFSIFGKNSRHYSIFLIKPKKAPEFTESRIMSH